MLSPIYSYLDIYLCVAVANELVLCERADFAIAEYTAITTGIGIIILPKDQFDNMDAPNTNGMILHTVSQMVVYKLCVCATELKLWKLINNRGPSY